MILRWKQINNMNDNRVSENLRIYYSSEGYYEWVRNTTLECASVIVRPDVIELSESCNKQSIEEINSTIQSINKEVKEGYWVYSFYCSDDWWQIKWYANKKEAEKAYNKLKVEYFLVCKVLLHTEKGILKYCK